MPGPQSLCRRERERGRERERERERESRHSKHATCITTPSSSNEGLGFATSLAEFVSRVESSRPRSLPHQSSGQRRRPRGPAPAHGFPTTPCREPPPLRAHLACTCSTL